MSLSIADLHWIAGFLEGEGCFSFKTSTRGRGLQVSAAQVEDYPLLKLKRLLGGSVLLTRRFHERNPNWSPVHLWHRGGMHGAALMMTIYPLMSPRRQEQIRRALTQWLAIPTRKEAYRLMGRRARERRTHCSNGHLYTPENTYTYFHPKRGRSWRMCVECRYMHTANSQRKKHEKRQS